MSTLTACLDNHSGVAAYRCIANRSLLACGDLPPKTVRVYYVGSVGEADHSDGKRYLKVRRRDLRPYMVPA